MAKTGRNDRCPCGSGKKLKKCCGTREGGADSAEESSALALHHADAEVAEEVSRWARRRFGAEWIEEAQDAFLADYELEQVELQLFIPWLVYGFEVEGRPPAAWFLEERGDKLSERTKGWLEAQLATWLSVWEVLEVEAERGLRLRDLLTREERFVHEVLAAQTLRPRDAVLARVVDCGGISTLCGMYPRALPPGDADFVVRAGRRFGGVRTRALSKEKMRALFLQVFLLQAWRQAVADHDRPQPPPILQNTDGDSVLLTKDHFEFEPQARAEVEAELCKLEGAQQPETDEGKGEVSISFITAGNARFKSWDNTTIGLAVVGAARLTLDTNSVKRADALRARVEAGLGSLLRHELREHSDVEALMKGYQEEPIRGTGGKAGSLVDSPEARAALREFKEKHMGHWLDEEIPALGGLTPRQAVARPGSRPKVDLLLRDMENRERGMPAEDRINYARLRQELGLPS